MTEWSAVLGGGLTGSQVTESRGRDGANLLPVPSGVGAVRRFAGELVHFFAALLWVAAGLALVAGLPQLSLAIAAVVLINAAFTFAQERRAERAADRLRDLIPRRVTVLRDGQRTLVDASELVVGDVVALTAGDRVPADLEAVFAHGLRIDASLLTGESAPVDVDAGAEVVGGTFVVQGEAWCRTRAVGRQTRLAGIAELTRSTTRPRSPLESEMRRLVHTIATLAVGVGVVFFTLGFAVGLAPRDGFVFAIGVAVALVPEALLPTVTLSLAVGAQRMAARHAVVRHLESVETLGSVTFICTDKTGTLTRNQMQVVRVWTPDGEVVLDGEGYEPAAEVTGSEAARQDARAAAGAALACSSGEIVSGPEGWEARGDPMEAAIDCLARRLSGTRPTGLDRARFPFDPERRRMSVVIGDHLYVKGAPESVVPLCRDVRPAVDGVVHRWTGHGLRLLAVARRDLAGNAPTAAVAAERDLTLLGLLAFEDPPRPEVAASLATARQGGVRVMMLTGDNVGTAVAVAREVGLGRPGSPVLTGDQLPSSLADLGEAVDQDGAVVARVSPEQKLRIAQALQGRGHVVAMTGDGVNDAPALREADIGVAMGRYGSDVAREAADLVLLDDDFATIVAAVEQGRATFLNVRRFLTYHLTDNVAELFPLVVWALTAGHFPLALGVLQILALDLATDTLSAVALGSEPPHRRVMSRRPIGGRLLTRVVAWRAFGLLGPLETLAATGVFSCVLIAAGWRWGDDPSPSLLASASGAYFLTVVLAQGANAVACRSSSLTPRELGWATNRMLLGAVAFALLMSLLMLLAPPVADLLGQRPPPGWAWLLALLAAPALLAVDALDKHARRRTTARAHDAPPVVVPGR